MALVLATGCMGSVGGDDEASQIGPAATGPSVEALTCDGKVTPPSIVMRRLTNDELHQTLKDLLGIDQPLGDALPPDSIVFQFDNNAAANSVSNLRVQAYQSIA